MTAQTLIESLTAASVRLWVDGETLKLDAPVGTITPELKATLAAHKAELLAALTSQHGACPHCRQSANLQDRALDAWFCPGCRLWMHGDGSSLPKIETPRPLTLEQQEAERLAADLYAAGCGFVADDDDWNVRLPVKISAALLTRFECSDRAELQRAIGKLAELESTQGWVN